MADHCPDVNRGGRILHLTKPLESIPPTDHCSLGSATKELRDREGVTSLLWSSGSKLL